MSKLTQQWGVFKKSAQKKRKGGGWNDEKTGGRHVTPVKWKREDGVYVGWDGGVWMYRAVELYPWTWADNSARSRYGAKMSDILGDVVGVTPTGLLPENLVKTNREFHVVSLTWETPAKAPEGNAEPLQEYQQSAFGGMMMPRRAVIVGVRLRPSGAREGAAKEQGAKGVSQKLMEYTMAIIGEDTPDIAAYAKDLREMDAILKRYSGRLMTREEMYYLESWYNLGRGPEARIVEEWDRLRIDNFDEIQMAALSDFHHPVLKAPIDTWILDSMNHSAGPHVVSIRGRLQPPRQARSRARRAMRWAYDQVEEEAKAGDVERREIDDVHSMAQTFDQHFTDTRYPLLTETSIIFARRVHNEVTETYAEELRNRYDIEIAPLVGRQLVALDETLPCSVKRVNPYPQELTTDMIGFSGINGWSGLGDTDGILLGVTVEDGVPSFLDPLGAPKANQPASMLVLGDTGSGKTFTLQNIAVQAVLAGLPVVMINPKGFDTLASTADLVGGQVIRLDELHEQGGYLDPFRFAEPEIAADIAAGHILAILRGLTDDKVYSLTAGLRQGALAGATCVGEALTHVDDAELVALIRKAATSDPRVGLGIAWEAREDFTVNSRLTLIEFGRDLDLPDPSASPSEYTPQQRSSIAAMLLIFRASLEMMAGRTGGVLIVDEAWTFLSQPSTRQALDGLGRKGRSLNVLPILATQKIADITGAEFESLLSRVLVLSLRESKEAAAALKLCGLEPDEWKIQFIADCGPRKQADGATRIPLAVYRDLSGRAGVLAMGPTPARARIAFTTNPEERQQREAEQEEWQELVDQRQAGELDSVTGKLVELQQAQRRQDDAGFELLNADTAQDSTPAEAGASSDPDSVAESDKWGSQPIQPDSAADKDGVEQEPLGVETSTDTLNAATSQAPDTSAAKMSADTPSPDVQPLRDASQEEPEDAVPDVDTVDGGWEQVPKRRR